MLGSLICGIARSSTTFIIGRAIAGVGGAGITTGALTITNTMCQTGRLATVLAQDGMVVMMVSIPPSCWFKLPGCDAN